MKVTTIPSVVGSLETMYKGSVNGSVRRRNNWTSGHPQDPSILYFGQNTQKSLEA